MKILIVSTNADEAGAPKHVEAIVNGLTHKFEFVLVFGERGPVENRLEQCGHTVHVISEMRTAISPIRDLVALLKLTRIVFIHKPDVIHCHSAKAGMLGRIAAALTRTSWVYTVHGWGWRGLPRGKAAIIISVEKLLSKLSHGRYIFVAQDVMRDGMSVLGLGEHRGRVIYNGLPEMQATSPPDNAPYTILMPARFSPAKDHQTLVAAFESLDWDDSRLLLCGSGTDSHEFVSLVKKIAPRNFSKIFFLGQQSAMEAIYSQCDVVALISNFEALPLTIIESMSCGKAIVATRVGGIPELVSHGVNGILVNPNAVEELRAAFESYSSRATRLLHGKSARKTYERLFKIDQMLASLEQMYYSHR